MELASHAVKCLYLTKNIPVFLPRRNLVMAWFGLTVFGLHWAVKRPLNEGGKNNTAPIGNRWNIYMLSLL